MRERLDCAILSTPGTSDWVRPWLGRHAGGRVHVQALDSQAGGADSCEVLARVAMPLRRFDVCLVPVSESNLAWVRTVLSAAQGLLQTPVLALVHQLKAAALNDLYALGLADFVRDPICPEELRVRIEQLLDERRYPMREPAGAARLKETHTAYPAGPGLNGSATEQALCATILERGGHELEAYAVATASRCATSKESFQAAKSKVVERFERAYITAALGRHSGNIAMAARAAQKHRRAFWALMRKHQIDAAPYRGECSPFIPPDG
ncbi:hypothetical protein LSG25_18160 [Paralcaligenes sp. KSB-10]|uniref:hypothetical protein n=1 Tax=Paralcaligenes sp. KSB-10 TaxID=2901142 RepID=UPI001E2F93FE|nr:hypothetical protein [Paralcaligenes sp. KSB-10]UHL63925.1 hypothetical protein LSG25_18160 [Paralcaligenes sp. KSB-10]